MDRAGLCVAIRRCSIPVAWKVIGAHEKESWPPHWEGLLKEVQGTVPHDWLVLVLADRGLYAHWLFDAIVENGWHPFLRITTQVKARPCAESTTDWITHWMPTPGTQWPGRVDCFVAKKCRLTCTLPMQWQEGDETGWAVITDLAPEEAQVAWYGLRCWVECGFKDFKREGFGWNDEKMKQAGRVKRLWLAMAVAQLWLVSLGTQAEREISEACPERLPEQHIARTRRKASSSRRPVRRLSCVARGRWVLLAALLQREALPISDLVPEDWPVCMGPPQKGLSASQVVKQEKQRKRKRRQKKAARLRQAVS